MALSKKHTFLEGGFELPQQGVFEHWNNGTFEWRFMNFHIRLSDKFLHSIVRQFYYSTVH